MNADALPVGGRERLAGLFIVLGSMGALGLSWPFLLAAALVLLMVRGGHAGSIVIPIGGVFLFVFLITRVFLLPDEAGSAQQLFLLGLLSFFVSYTLGVDGGSRARLAVMSFVAGNTLHALINASMIFSEHGLIPDTRIFDDVWMQDIWNATGHATLWIPLLGAMPYLLLAHRGRRGSLGSWVLLAVAVWASTALASRTMMGVLAISFLLAVAIILIRQQRLSRLIGGVVSGGAALGALYLWLPREVLLSLPLVDRLVSDDASLQEDPRLDRWAYYSQHVWETMGGERKLQESVGYAHNLWLDSYDADGALPFVLLVLFTIAFLGNLFRVYKRLDGDIGLTLLILGVGTAWLVQAFTEPLIDLSPLAFATGCGFAGVTAGLLRGARGRDMPQPVKAAHSVPLSAKQA